MMNATNKLVWVKLEEGVPAFYEECHTGSLQEALEELNSRKDAFLFGQVLESDGKVFANVGGNANAPACA